MGRQLNI